MKKIIIVALTALVMVGCDYRTDVQIEEAKRLNGFNIVVIDSCEYLEKSDAYGYNGYGYLPTKVTAVFAKNAKSKN